MRWRLRRQKEGLKGEGRISKCYFIKASTYEEVIQRYNGGFEGNPTLTAKRVISIMKDGEDWILFAEAEAQDVLYENCPHCGGRINYRYTAHLPISGGER